MKPETGPPMTLGNAAAAHVRLIVWCRACRHQVEPDPTEMAERSCCHPRVRRAARVHPPLQPQPFRSDREFIGSLQLGDFLADLASRVRTNTRRCRTRDRGFGMTI